MNNINNNNEIVVKNIFVESDGNCQPDDLVSEIFSPIRQCCKLLWLSFLNSKNKKLNKFFEIFRLFYQFSVFVLLSVIFIFLLIPLFSNRQKLDSSFVQSLGHPIWVCESLVSFCYITYWLREKCIYKLNQKLLKATNQKGVKKFYQRLKRFQFVGSIFFFVSVIGYFAHAVGITYKLLDLNIDLTYTDKVYLLNKFYVNVFGVFGSVYLCSSWYLATFAYSAICQCLWAEYKTVNENFNKELFLNTDVIIGYIKNYNSLRSVVEYVNKVFSGYIFINLCGNVIINVLLLFSMLTIKHNYLEYMFISQWLFCSFLQLWSLAWLPATINVEVQ